MQQSNTTFSDVPNVQAAMHQSIPPAVHFRLQIQLQQPLQQPPQPLQQPAQQPQLQTPQSQQEPQQTPLQQPAQMHQEPINITQIIQLLQLVQQLRTPPLQPQFSPYSAQHLPTHRNAQQLYQRRFHPYYTHLHPQPSVVAPSSSPQNAPSSSPSPRTTSCQPAPDQHRPSIPSQSTDPRNTTLPSETPTPFTPPTPLSPQQAPQDDAELRSVSKRGKTDYTMEFKDRFSKILQLCEASQNAWRAFRSARAACTVARTPCIKVYRGFCEDYGGELRALSREEKYEKLGTLTKCHCAPA